MKTDLRETIQIVNPGAITQGVGGGGGQQQLQLNSNQMPFDLIRSLSGSSVRSGLSSHMMEESGCGHLRKSTDKDVQSGDKLNKENLERVSKPEINPNETQQTPSHINKKNLQHGSLDEASIQSIEEFLASIRDFLTFAPILIYLGLTYICPRIDFSQH